MVKKCLSLRIYGWLGKISWIIIAWKTRLLQPLKYRRYYWCAGYAYAKRVCEDFEINNSEGYHDLYVQSGTL